MHGAYVVIKLADPLISASWAYSAIRCAAGLRITCWRLYPRPMGTTICSWWEALGGLANPAISRVARWLRGSEPAPTHWDRAKTAFAKLWVAGTLGAFFSGLAQHIPVHAQELCLWRSCEIDYAYTLDHVVRYLYVLWLLAYFFVSNMRKEAVPPVPFLRFRDLAFDVVQSAASLGGAFLLGFFGPGDVYNFANYDNPDHVLRAVRGGSGAILVICSFSLMFFGCDEEEVRQSQTTHGCLNKLRFAGLLLSAGSLAVAKFGECSLVCTYTVVLVAQVGLFAVVLRFFRLSLKD